MMLSLRSTKDIGRLIGSVPKSIGWPHGRPTAIPRNAVEKGNGTFHIIRRVLMCRTFIKEREIKCKSQKCVMAGSY